MELNTFFMRCSITADKPECKSTDQGAEYRGTVSTTVSGKTCQEWRSDTPQAHSIVPEDEGLEGLCLAQVHF